MFLQLPSNFTFQSIFEQAQHETQLCDDMNLFTVYFDGSRNPTALKANSVLIPGVLNIKFICKVAGEFVSRILGIFTAHRMQSMNIDCGHNLYNLHLAASSLVPVSLCNQPSSKRVAQ